MANTESQPPESSLADRVGNLEALLIKQSDKEFEADVYRKAIEVQVREHVYGKLSRMVGLIATLAALGLAGSAILYIDKLVDDRVQALDPRMGPLLDAAERDKLLFRLAQYKHEYRPAIPVDRFGATMKTLIGEKPTELTPERDLVLAYLKEHPIRALRYALFEFFEQPHAPEQQRIAAFEALLGHAAEYQDATVRHMLLRQLKDHVEDNSPLVPDMVRILAASKAAQEERFRNEVVTMLTRDIHPSSQRAALAAVKGFRDNAPLARALSKVSKSPHVDGAVFEDFLLEVVRRRIGISESLLETYVHSPDRFRTTWALAYMALETAKTKHLALPEQRPTSKDWLDLVRVRRKARDAQSVADVLSTLLSKTTGREKERSLVELCWLHLAADEMKEGRDGLYDMMAQQESEVGYEPWVRLLFVPVREARVEFKSGVSNAPIENLLRQDAAAQRDLRERFRVAMQALPALRALREGSLDEYLRFMSESYFPQTTWDSEVSPLFPEHGGAADLRPEDAQDALWGWVEQEAFRLKWDPNQREYRIDDSVLDRRAQEAQESIRELRGGELSPYLNFMNEYYYEDDRWRSEVQPLFPDWSAEVPEGDTQVAQDDLWEWVEANADRLAWDPEANRYRLSG